MAHVLSAALLTILIGDVVTMSVATQYGTVVGTEETDCIAFYGIPFAKPPKRWRPPEELEKLPSEPYLADSWKPMCYQICKQPIGACGKEASEDCLYLNIFVPKEMSSFSKKAVLLFIHGGAFSLYTGGADLLHGGKLVQKGDIVVVTINYRLNVFGGLVTGNTENDAKGNYGILDQRMAIDWVYGNIEDFGGDQTKITLAGQSAGAQSVLIHTMANKVTDKFANVLIQSAPISIPFRSYKNSLKQGKKFAAEIGCKSYNIDCMREKPAEEVYNAASRVSRLISDSLLQMAEVWLPVADGDEVPNSIYEVFGDPLVPWFNSERVLRKPTIIGTVADEGTGFVNYIFKKKMSPVIFFIILLKVKQTNSFKVLRYYSPKIGQLTDTRNTASDALTDFVFVCPSRLMAQKIQQTAPVWIYSAEQSYTSSEASIFCKGKVCHGEDIIFMFQQIGKIKSPMISQEKKMSDSMIQYLTNFVKNGNPNNGMGSDLLMWPQYKNGSTELKQMVFTTPTNFIRANFKGPECDMWDHVQPYYA